MKYLSWLVIFGVAIGIVDAPLLRAGLPLGDDTEIHLYRLVDLDHLIRQGILYSRWQPDLVYGYGYPLFTYYAPLSAYLAELAHLLGFSFKDGLAVVFGALPLVAGGATFGFLRRRLARGPALLGGVAYPLSLYYLYNLYVRGSISDALAMTLFPVVLLLADRLAENPGPLRVAPLALAYAALLLSHDISGPLLLPLLILVGAWWSQGSRRALGWLTAAIGLGVAMALFFLGPAVLGIPDTRVPEFLATPGMHYDRHFLPLGSLLALVAVAHPGAMLTNLPISLGLLPTMLSLSALLGLRGLQPRARGEVVIFAATLLVAAGLTLPVSQPVWARLPMLQILHYPWRLLAIATLAEAVLIGYAGQIFLAYRPPRMQGLGLGAVAAILLVVAVPYLYPLPGDGLPANPDLAMVTIFQQRSRALGTTSNSEFLPRGVTDFPAGPPFAGADLGARLAEKLDPQSVPRGAQVQVESSSQLAANLVVDTPRPFLARFFVFRFPGWSAWLDGEATPLGNPGPVQTLTVPVPAGQHDLVVRFGETRRQQAFDVVSLIALVATLGLASVGLRLRSRCAGSTTDWMSAPERRCDTAPWPARDPPPGHSGERRREADRPAGERAPEVAGLGAVAAVLAILFWTGALESGAFPLVQPVNGGNPPGMAVAAPHRFDDRLDLLGYAVNPSVARPGGAVTITLYWRTTAPLAADYSAFVHLVADDGRMVAQADNVHVADFPTSRWRVGAYAEDIHHLRLPAAIQPGEYRVDAGVYDRSNQHRFSVDGGPSQGSSAAVSLFRLKVTAP